MSIKIHHGPPGSYKTSGAVMDDFVPAALAGRVVVTNVRGLNDAALVRQVLTKPPGLLRRDLKFWPWKPVTVPDSFDIIWIDTTTNTGRMKLLTFFHWVPSGAFLLIDEAQFVFPKALTVKHIQQLDFPGGVEAAARAGKPPDFLTAFDMHRHYNWDMVLTTPCISKIRSDIRDASEGAFKHRNSAMVGLKGRYREGFHSAEDTGKSDSDIITNRGRKIKPFVWQLYASTATGNFTDTTAGLSLFKNPRILLLLFLLSVIGGYVLYAPAPKPLKQAFASVNNQAVSADAKSSTSSSSPVSVPARAPGFDDSHRVGIRPVPPSGAVAATSTASTSPPAPERPYKDFEFRLLGSSLWKNAFHIHIQATTETRKMVLSDTDLVAAGYQWRLISPCHAILTFAGVEYPVYCSQSAIPQGHPVIDPVRVASNTFH